MLNSFASNQTVGLYGKAEQNTTIEACKISLSFTFQLGHYSTLH